MDTLKAKLEESRSVYNFQVSKLDMTRKSYEEEAIARSKPGGGGVPGSTLPNIGSNSMAFIPATINSLTTSFATSASNVFNLANNASAPPPVSRSQTAVNLSTVANGSSHSYDKNALTAMIPTEKEGYLYKRNLQKSALAVPVWSRRYFCIKNGGFGYHVLATSGKYRGCVMTTKFLNVLLCEVRVDRTQERRFCFEVISMKK